MASAVRDYPRLTASVEEVVAILGIGRSIVVPVPLLFDWLGVSPDRVPFRPGGNQYGRVR